MAAVMYLGNDTVSPVVDVTASSQMTDQYLIYRYLGDEEGYYYGKLYYWSVSEFKPLVGDGSGGGGGGGGTDDYNDLRNKPKIEGVILGGDKSFEDLNLEPITNWEIEFMLT